MRRALIFGFLLTLSCRTSLAQGVRHVNIALGTVTLAGSSGFSGAVSRPLAGASVTVCTGSALPSPGSVCTGLASIYVDIGLTGLLSNPTSADSAGNYSFYAPGGVPYVISVSAVGFTTYSYVWSAPISTSGALVLTGNFTATAVCNTNGVLWVSNPGCYTTLAAAIAALPSTGGIVDARGSGNMTISSTVNVGSSTQAVRLLLGPFTYTVTYPAQIILGNASEIIGSGNGTLASANPTQIQGNHTTAIIVVTANTSSDTKIRNLRIDNTSNTNVGGVGIQIGNGVASLVEDVAFTNLETGISLLATATYVEIVRPVGTNTNKTTIKIVGNQNIVRGGRITGGTVGIDIDGGTNRVEGTDLENLTTAGVRVGNSVSVASSNNEILLGYTQANTVDVQVLNNQGGGSVNRVYAGGGTTVSDAGAATTVIGNLGLATVDATAKLYNTGVLGTGDHEWMVRNNGAAGFVLWDDSQVGASRGWLYQYSSANTQIGPVALGGAFTNLFQLNRTGTFGFTGGTSDPTGVAGNLYYRTDLSRPRYFDTAWHSLLPSGTISGGTGKTLCTDANNFATTSGCTTAYTNWGTNNSCSQTGAAAGATQTCTITLNTTEADTAYKVVCGGTGTITGYPFMQGVTTKNTGSVVVQYTNGTANEATASGWGVIECIVTR